MKHIQNKPALCVTERDQNQAGSKEHLPNNTGRELPRESGSVPHTEEGEGKAAPKLGTAWLREPSLNRGHVRFVSLPSRLR